MKRELIVEIDCGDTTCASEPGKFCRFMGTSKFGSIFHCMLFRDLTVWRGPDEVRLEEKDGWLQRCPQCLELEKTGIFK